MKMKMQTIKTFKLMIIVSLNWAKSITFTSTIIGIIYILLIVDYFSQFL